MVVRCCVGPLQEWPVPLTAELSLSPSIPFGKHYFRVAVELGDCLLLSFSSVKGGTG